MTVYGNEKCNWMFLHTLEVEDDSQNIRDCVGFEQIHAFKTLQLDGYEIQVLRAFHDPKEECLIYLIRDSRGKRYCTPTIPDIFQRIPGKHCGEQQSTV